MRHKIELHYTRSIVYGTWRAHSVDYVYLETADFDGIEITSAKVIESKTTDAGKCSP